MQVGGIGNAQHLEKHLPGTDNGAQGQSAKLANGVILCFLFFVLRGWVIFTMFRRMSRRMVEILKIDVNKLHAVHQVSDYSRAVLKSDRLI